MRLVVLGAPGAGKGTQARNLAKHFNSTHISTGELLRQEILNNTGIGASIKELMDKGRLVPDDVVMGLIRDKLAEGRYVLDGYPRTLLQAKTLDELNASLNMPLDRAIYVNVPDGVIAERMSGRLTCPACGALFHAVYYPPKQPHICDNCGGKLIQRDDDKTHTVLNRLKLYHEITEPIIGHYKAQGLLLEVSGVGEMDEITDNIIKALV